MLDKEKVKGFFTTKGLVPVWAFFVIMLCSLGLIIFAEQMGYSDGYKDALNKNLVTQIEHENWEEWNTYDFETRKESFWSVIMWDVANNTKNIFIALVLVLLLLAIRW